MLRTLLISLCLLLTGQISFEQTRDNYDAEDCYSTLSSPECNSSRDASGKIFTKLEALAEFPGGFKKWYEFAGHQFDFKQVLQSMGDSVKELQDSIVIKFVVTRNGTICNIKLQNGNPIFLKSTKNFSTYHLPGCLEQMAIVN